MSKERLEEIKDKVSLLRNSSELQPYEFLIDVLHLDWLIEYAKEQVERVDCLEAERNYYERNSEKRRGDLTSIYVLLEEDYFENLEEAMEIAYKGRRDFVLMDNLEIEKPIRTTKENLIKQNKRYREAMEFYADRKTYTDKVNDEWGSATAILVDRGEKAREAMEESE